MIMKIFVCLAFITLGITTQKHLLNPSIFNAFKGEYYENMKEVAIICSFLIWLSIATFLAVVCTNGFLV